MRKFLVIMLALMLAFSMSAVTFAAEKADDVATVEKEAVDGDAAEDEDLAAEAPAFEIPVPDKVVVSTQPLKVNGVIVAVQPYNIDGSNYFKLRDLAALLTGTGSQFNVSFKDGNIIVTTGEVYEPLDSDLAVGEDMSASAKPSPQTLVVDGEIIDTVHVYNIGGSNYFQLRELNKLVGFDVTYDEATRTMIVDTVINFPAEIQEIVTSVTKLAEKIAKELDGEWGDLHAAMMASEKNEKFESFGKMKAVLDKFRTESGAYYVYAFYPVGDPASSAFKITVDGSEEPDEFGTEYEYEIQFTEAWNGKPAAARSSWDNDTDDPVWSAFAPVHNSEGKVVVLLGVDFPAPVVLEFPEWNRDSEVWNGIKR